MRYHYNQDIGQTVTMVRFNPQGTGLLAARGTITCETGYNKIGCDTGLLVDVENKRKFFKAQCNYGHHMTWLTGTLPSSWRTWARPWASPWSAYERPCA